jgi:isobutyryl-CoA mutase
MLPCIALCQNICFQSQVEKQSAIAGRLYAVIQTQRELRDRNEERYEELSENLNSLEGDLRKDLDGECQRILDGWEKKTARYKADEFVYKVRNKEIRVPTHTESLSRTKFRG